jgi:hypothetical protein
LEAFDKSAVPVAAVLPDLFEDFVQTLVSWVDVVPKEFDFCVLDVRSHLDAGDEFKAIMDADTAVKVRRNRIVVRDGDGINATLLRLVDAVRN